MVTITSRTNAIVKEYRELVRSKDERKETGKLPIEGARLVGEALSCGLEIKQLLITEKASVKYSELYEQIDNLCLVTFISDDIAGYISDTQTPQGIFAVVSFDTAKPFNEEAAEKGNKFILLEDLQDPGNIGTIIRTCDAFGIDGLVLSPYCTDAFSPKVLRATMGSAFRLKVYRDDLLQTVGMLKNKGFETYAALLDKNSERLGEFEITERFAAVIGNEGNGVTDALAKKCGRSVFIPMQSAESLNASVAASIIAWEMTKGK